MNSDILFVSKGNEKGVFFTKGDVIIKSYCSLPGNCPTQERCQSCETIDSIKKYLKNRTSNSNVKTLDGELSVGIGEYKIGKKVLLQAMGLGSCIGIVLYDNSTGIGGIAHILLPGASQNGETKYAETAIEKMLEDMVKKGAQRNKIVSKFAGGAQVFRHMNLEILKIGSRNSRSVQETLGKKKIPILAKDVGGEVGRNVIFNPTDGSMIVKYTKGNTIWL
jgi:chemotaxis protein CheD